MAGRASILSPLPNAASANGPITGRRSPGRAAEVTALALILAVGAYLRFAALDLAQFRLDDIALWDIARFVAEQPQVITRGIPASVAGFSNGPFQAYLLLPAALLGADPFAAYVSVALLNVAAIALFWAFVRSYWRPSLALLAALLYAVNPWAVVFSRRLWGNDLVAPFTVLLIWSLCDLARYGRRRDSVLPLLWLAIVTQVYVGALTHVILVALGMGFGARRLRPPYLVAGLALFAILMAPYLLGTLLPNAAQLPLVFGSSDRAAQADLTSLLFTLHSVSSEGYQAFANNAGAIFDATQGLPEVVSWLAEALLALGMGAALADVVCCLRRRKGEGALPPLLLLAAVLIPALLLVRHSAPVFVYYLIVGFPAHFLLVALGVRALWSLLRAQGPRWLAQGAAAGVTLAIVGTHLVLAQVFFAAIQEYWPKSDYGVPLRYTAELAGKVRALARQHSFSRVYLAGLANREGVLFRVLRPELPQLGFVDLANTFVMPASATGDVLLILPTGDGPIGRAFGERFAGSAVASLDVPGDGLRYAAFAMPKDASDQWLASLGQLPGVSPAIPYSARLDDYLELVGYDRPAEGRPGESVRVTLYWKVLGSPPAEFNLFAHLIGGLGSQWGQQDGLNYPAEQWQPGDLFVQSHDIPVPVGAPPVEYEVNAGGYFKASGQRLVVRRGETTDDRLRLGTVKVSRPATQPQLPPMTPVGGQFGESIRLLGYRLNTRAPTPGDHLSLTLYWQSLALSPVDYTVFNHLAGADSRPLAQGDGPPAFGAFPTAAWQPGDVIRDVHEIVVPGGLAPGRYWLLTGLYATPNGPRLSPAGASRSPWQRLGQWLENKTPYSGGPRVDGDRVVLTAVDVQRGR